MRRLLPVGSKYSEDVTLTKANMEEEGKGKKSYIRPEPQETLQETAERAAQVEAEKTGGPERQINPADLQQQWNSTFKEAHDVDEFVNLIQTDMLNSPQNYDSAVHGVETMAKLFPMLKNDKYENIDRWRNKAVGATFNAARTLKDIRGATGSGPKRDDVRHRIRNFILDIREAEKAYDIKQERWGRKTDPSPERSPSPEPAKPKKRRSREAERADRYKQQELERTPSPEPAKPKKRRSREADRADRFKEQESERKIKVRQENVSKLEKLIKDGKDKEGKLSLQLIEERNTLKSLQPQKKSCQTCCAPADTTST